MIAIQGKLPREVTVAFSGGVDSVAIVDFLKNNHTVNLVFINHGTETSSIAETFVTTYAENNDLALHVFSINTTVPIGVSQEEHWRNERYSIFHSFDTPVITGHHLDDCVEQWLFSSLHGKGNIIPYANRNVIRPFRLNKKEEFIRWCNKRDVNWVEDKSNQDTKYMRNFIRHEILPRALLVNPGLHKVVRKKILNEV